MQKYSAFVHSSQNAYLHRVSHLRLLFLRIQSTAINMVKSVNEKQEAGFR